MNKVLMIGGPTAIGKSSIAVRLAKRYNGIIVGADSMQIYKGLNIGTGKITEEEKEGIVHTMIDIVSPDTVYSVQQYCQDARKIIETAHSQNKLPIVVGGTGLYLNALLNEQNFADAQPNAEIRARYNAIAEEKGKEYLHFLLQKIDPTAAQKISVNDVKRTIRALEIYEQNGKAKTDSVAQTRSPYDTAFYILQTDREKLYARINARVDTMLQSGWIEEVKQLQPYWNCNCMQAIGYKEIIHALQNGTDPLAEWERIRQNTRKYAKRQITFLKWIRQEKIYVTEDFYTNIIATCDAWVQKEQKKS